MNLALLFVACAGDPSVPRREFMPEMIDSLAYESFSANPVTRDGKTLQPPPAGSIPRGWVPLRFGAGPAEAERAGRELHSPIPESPAAVARGATVFESFCTPCHGPRGEGDGTIIPRFPMPPSLTAAHAKSLPDGRIYHIVSRGQGLMAPHAIQVRPDDRWRLVQYIRSLQGGPQGGPG